MKLLSISVPAPLALGGLKNSRSPVLVFMALMSGTYLVPKVPPVSTVEVLVRQYSTGRPSLYNTGARGG